MLVGVVVMTTVRTEARPAIEDITESDVYDDITQSSMLSDDISRLKSKRNAQMGPSAPSGPVPLLPAVPVKAAPVDPAIFGPLVAAQAPLPPLGPIMPLSSMKMTATFT